MSSKHLHAAAAAGTLALAAVAAPAAAQDAAAAAARNSVGERFESALGTLPSSRDGLSALVTGYEDLILLEKRKFFTAWGSVSPQWTSNAPLTPDGDSDLLAVANAGLRASTTLADTVDVHASIGALSAWYQDFDELDYSALTATLGAARAFATPAGTLSIGADYAPALIYDDGFSDREQTRHRFAGTVQLWSPLGGWPALAGSQRAQETALVPTLVVERVLTDPEEYEYTGASLDVAFIWRPLQAWQLGASVGAFLRDYDDYFEGLVGDSRRDDGFRAGVYAQWTPREFVSVSVGADYTDNSSTSDVNEYDVTSVTPAATFSVRF